MQTRSRRLAIIFYRCFQIALAAFGAAGLALFIISPRLIRPWEDAIILFAYSNNLADTGISSSFPGGPRTEGATDFLWMVILAFGRKVGLDVFYSANIISACSAIGIAILVQKIAHRRPRLYPTLILTGVIFLTPQTLAAAGGFSVFPFGFLITMLTWCLLEQRPAAACLAALVLCLFRPDGIVFALPLLAMFLFSGENYKRALKSLILFFLLPGLIYFLWRWHYFENLLPLPFWVKSETTRRFGLYVPSAPIEGLRHIELALLVIAASCGLALKLGTNLRLICCLLIIPSVFYFQMRLDQNIGARFFFFAYLSIGIVTAVNWERLFIVPEFLLPATLAFWAFAVAPFWVAVAHLIVLESRLPQPTVAGGLAAVPGQNSMITTEAGALPYYSRWIAYDAWGLNTAKFARHIPLPSDVVNIHPDLVIVHRLDGSPCFFDPSWQQPYSLRTWDNMEKNLIAGANSSNYDLWLQDFPTGSHNYICWFLRRDAANRSAIERVLGGNAFVPPLVALRMDIQEERQRQDAIETELDRISHDIVRLQESYVFLANRQK